MSDEGRPWHHPLSRTREAVTWAVALVTFGVVILGLWPDVPPAIWLLTVAVAALLVTHSRRLARWRREETRSD